MKTIEASVGKWFGILTHFGVDQCFLKNKHGPCPMCGGTDRFRWDNKDGSGSYICSYCRSGDGMKLLMEVTGMDFKTAAKSVDSVIGNITAEKPKPKPNKDPKDRLRKIALGLQEMGDINPVRLYLRTRGVKPSKVTQYHPSMAYYEHGKYVNNYPAMVHLFTSHDGKPASYHITYLQSSGYKADVESQRKMMTPLVPLSGGAIRLMDCKSILGVAEGIETALAAYEKTGTPCWATYSATLLEQFVPPAGVDRVIIFGDNDMSFTGQASAYKLARRLFSQGYGVEVRIPEVKGKDWADEVTA